MLGCGGNESKGAAQGSQERKGRMQIETEGEVRDDASYMMKITFSKQGGLKSMKLLQETLVCQDQSQHWGVISGDEEEVMDLKLFRQRMEGLVNLTQRMKERADPKTILES